MKAEKGGGRGGGREVEDRGGGRGEGLGGEGEMGKGGPYPALIATKQVKHSSA